MLMADEPQSPWVDPIVAEVRAARERIVAAVGGDLHLLCEQLRARQAAAGRIPVDSRATRFKTTEIGNRPSGIARESDRSGRQIATASISALPPLLTANGS